MSRRACYPRAVRFLAILLAAGLGACTPSPSPTAAPSAAPPAEATTARGKPSSGWGVPGECINAAPNTKLPAYCSHPECFGAAPPAECAELLKRH